MENKPDTLRASRLKEWIRVRFLYPYLKSIPPEEKTLDLACGYGFSFQLNPNFYGIELDQGAYLSCKERNLKVVQGSILEPFDYPAEFFDNCFSHDVLEHFDLEDIPTIFSQVHRVLRRGGTFMNVVPNRKGYDYGFEINAGHKHFITPEEISEIAAKSGFRMERVYTSPLPRVFHEWFTHNKVVTLCTKL